VCTFVHICFFVQKQDINKVKSNYGNPAFKNVYRTLMILYLKTNRLLFNRT